MIRPLLMMCPLDQVRWSLTERRQMASFARLRNLYPLLIAIILTLAVLTLRSPHSLM